MIKLIAKVGRINTVIAIALISAAASTLVTASATSLLNSYGSSIDLKVAIAFGACVPLVVAPPISWYFVGLMLRIYAIEKEMRKLASYDSLTGLLTRHAFFDSANNYLSLADRDHAVFSVLIIDLDHFKSINDQYGHPAGDAVLRLFADIINSVSRRSDIIGRLGGEEFGVILPSTAAAEGLEFAGRLQAAINKAVLKHQDDIIDYTVSIGLTSSASAADEPIDTLLAHADLALYQAKRGGRNQTAVYREALEHVASA